MMARELEVELVPQGSLIERIRAGGYGLGGILTQTGLGTLARMASDALKLMERAFYSKPRFGRTSLSSKHFSPTIFAISWQFELCANSPQFQSIDRDGSGNRYRQRR